MRYEFGGGIVGADGIYVERSLDSELIASLRERRHLAVVTAPRQSGKSSLISRVLQGLEQSGQRTSYVDLRTAIGPPEAANTKAADWYRLIFERIAGGLGLKNPNVEEQITTRQAQPHVRQTIDFLKFCRDAHSGPIVVAIDEIDFISLFGSHTDHLFEAMRSIASEQKLDMSFLLASVNHPSELLKTLSSSTFNVFQAHRLGDFDMKPDTVAKWSAGLPWSDEIRRAVGREVLHQTGGQPYLTSVLFQRAIDDSAQDERAIQRLAEDIAKQREDDPQLRAHFRAPQDILLQDQSRAWEALDLLGKTSDGPVLSAGARRPVVNLLVTAGLVRENEGRIAVKSPIYARAFDRAWIEETKSRIGFTNYRSKAPASFRSEAKPTICVINTGGMISMELKEDGKIDAPADLSEFFSDFPEMQEIANIDTLALMCKDSSNMAPADWKAVAEAIYQRRIRDYRGFVVCHGTDTLAYTASAVAFALGPGLKVPVVFTAAQTPRHVLYGDARINILRACKVATLQIPEVVVSIGDHVYRAVRAEKKDDYRFDAFHSPTMPPLATVAQDIELQEHLIRVPDRSRGMECNANFSEGVFKITFYPGLNPDFLEPILDNPNVSGLIIETPGIGVLPTDGDISLLGLVTRATAKSIPVLLVSQYPIQAELKNAYKLLDLPIQAGAIPAVNMSAPAAVTKFMWVLAQVEKEIQSGAVLREEKRSQIIEYMTIRDLVGELDARELTQLASEKGAQP